MTAVEWLQEKYNSRQVYEESIFDEEFEQAKTMEKEQHGNTWDEAINTHERRGHVIARSIVDFDDYYNENYNK